MGDASVDDVHVAHPLVTSGMSVAYTLAITHIELRSATVNAGVVPAGEQLAGIDELFDHGSRNGRDDRALHRRRALAVADRVDRGVVEAERTQREHRRVAVRLGAGVVRARLVELAARERVVREQLFVELEDPRGVAHGRLGLAVRRDVGGEVRRRHDASACPAVTFAPSVATIRDTGPDTGESTCVDLSPLNATVPVTSSVGPKFSRRERDDRQLRALLRRSP